MSTAVANEKLYDYLNTRLSLRDKLIMDLLKDVPWIPKEPSAGTQKAWEKLTVELSAKHNNRYTCDFLSEMRVNQHSDPRRPVEMLLDKFRNHYGTVGEMSEACRNIGLTDVANALLN
jgi:hypothetical protein